MTAPIGFTPSVSTTVPPRSVACGRAPAPFDTLTVPQFDQLRDKLLTTRLETLQDWAAKEFPHFQAPPRQAWLDLYTRTLLQIIREERPASKDLELLLLEKYPSSHGFRIADTAIASLQRHLDEALAQPQPDAKQIKIWFTLLIEQEKVDIDRHRYGIKPPANKLTEMEIRRDMFNILGFPQFEQDRIESEIAADRAKEAAALGRTDASSVPAGTSPAEPPTEPTPANPHHPTDLLGQPLAEHNSSDHPPFGVPPSGGSAPAHPFSVFVAAPLDPSAPAGSIVAVRQHLSAAPSGGEGGRRPGEVASSLHPTDPTDPSDPSAHPSTQKTGGGAPLECGSSLPLSPTQPPPLTQPDPTLTPITP